MKCSFSILLVLLIYFSNPDLHSQQYGWFQLNSGTTINLSQTYFVNSNTGIVTSYSPVILRTTDGGLTWNQIVYPNNIIWFWGVTFVDENTGWVAGYSLTAPYPNVILKTTNSGINWFEQHQANGQIRNVFFLNSQTGWIAGDSLLKTTNAGTNWIASKPPTYQPALSLYFIDQFTGWIGGNVNSSETIMKTTDGGNNWISQITGAEHVYDIKFTSALTGFAAGHQGILKTTNGGDNWFVSYYAAWGSSLCFLSPETGWASSFVTNPLEGKIIKTTNAGYSWSIQHVKAGETYFVFMLSTLLGWIVGDGGVIYKTTNGGEPVSITNINTNFPNKFLLYQNYPNPFNPISKIKLDIARRENVKLTVFDMLGREVAVLVNEQLKPGTYEVQFDGTNYPSGVYFYRLVTQDFVDTKKMVLIK